MFGDAYTDGQMIAAAMEYGKSRLNQAQRGKGLGDILRPVLADPSNSLRIISGRGLYKYAGGRPSYETVSCPLLGTLIEWDLALSDGKDDMDGLELRAP